MPLFDEFVSNLKQMEADCRFDMTAIDGDAMTFFSSLAQHAVDDPEPIFAILRRIRPVLLVKNFALVTLHADVQDVLVQDQVFGVPYGPKMRVVTNGPDFFLGMPNSPAYERDTSHMRSVIRRTDLPNVIVPFVAASDGYLELVSQLTKPTPTQMICNYFGYPPDSVPELVAWASTIFQYFFTDLNNDPIVDASARDASAHVRGWLDRCIVQQRAAPTADDTVLNRGFALQQAGLPAMDDVAIRDNLLGAIPTTSKCCAQALDELFKRPAMLAAAQQAAVQNDDATLAAYIFEALRFHPNNPGVFRVTLEDYVVGKGTMHATNIPAGTSFLAATQSAMFDDAVVESPNDFRIDRPAYTYMHWGSACTPASASTSARFRSPASSSRCFKCKILDARQVQLDCLLRVGPFMLRLRAALQQAVFASRQFSRARRAKSPHRRCSFVNDAEAIFAGADVKVSLCSLVPCRLK
jgi:cytochrome P450